MGKRIVALVLFTIFVLPFIAMFSPLFALLLFLGGLFFLFHNSSNVVSQTAASDKHTSQTLQEIAGQIQVAKNVANDSATIAGLDQALEIIQRYSQSAPGTATTARPAMVTAQAPVVMTPPTKDELAAQKEKQAQQNTNTMLYVASFLLVGAAVLFIGTALDATSKFIGLIIITLGFYITGMWLHASMPKLRPAAVAFVGTGLALVPFVGLAFYTYIMPDASWAWFLTSVIGLVMFLYATVTIRNQTLAYLTSAFVFSFTTSSLSVMSIPFVWYFVMIMITGALLAYLAYKKPQWLPSELQKPFEQNGQLAVPLVIVGSLLVADRFTLSDYKIIVGVATLYYLAAALGLGSVTKKLYWTFGRVGVAALAALWAYGYRENSSDVAAAIMATGLLAYLYSRRFMQDAYEKGWVVYSQAAVAAATLLWAMPTIMMRDVPMATLPVSDWTSVTFGLVILGSLSFMQLLEFKKSWYGWGFALQIILLPLTIIYGVMDTPYAHEYLAFVTILIAGAGLMARQLLPRYFAPAVDVVKVIYIVALAESLFAAFATGSTGWMASITMVAAVLVFLASFVETEALLLVAANLLYVVGVWYCLSYFTVANDWRLLLAALIASGTWYALRWYYETHDHKRRDIMIGSTFIALLLGGLFSAYNDVTLVAACLTGCVLAGLLVYEGYLAKQPSYRELAVAVGTISLQRLIAYSYPEASIIFYTHWWAASLALTAWLRLNDGQRNEAKTRGILALCILSIPTGLAAIGDPDTYRLLFLFEHIVLLIGGFMTNKKLVVQWGTAGIALALIWLLQGYTYVLLALAAFALIGLAIWRLTKSRD